MSPKKELSSKVLKKLTLEILILNMNGVARLPILCEMLALLTFIRLKSTFDNLPFTGAQLNFIEQIESLKTLSKIV